MMEKAVPEGLEVVCVKAEPCLQQACVEEEPSCLNGCVKDEPSSEVEGARGVCEAAAALYADHVVKDELVLGPELVQPRRELSTAQEEEPPCLDACVKEEPSSEEEGARGISEAAAAAALYADHVVKDELVLGPELVQPRRKLFAAPGQPRLADKNDPQKTNKCQAWVEERKDKNTVKLNPVEKLQGKFTTPQVSPIYMNIQEVVLGQSVVNTVTSKTDSNATNLKCDQCGKIFDMKSDLEKHIQTHELMNKSRNQRASKDFTCKICSCTFETKLLLQGHAKSQHAVEYFSCAECEYKTCYKQELRCHLRTHTGERPFKCNECSSAFIQLGHLKSHLRTHTGEKPYKCNHCSSTFTESGHLKAHLRRHTGEKPYQCNQCSAAFTESGSLKRHLRTHTGEKPYKCNQCSSTFTESGHLKAHLWTH